MVLFIIARSGEPPRCPSVDEWVKKTVVHPGNGASLSTERNRAAEP